MKTPGQIAYEAFWIDQRYSNEWSRQTPKVHAMWESVAQAVIAFYETGIEGAK